MNVQQFQWRTQNINEFHIQNTILCVDFILLVSIPVSRFIFIVVFIAMHVGFKYFETVCIWHPIFLLDPMLFSQQLWLWLVLITFQDVILISLSRHLVFSFLSTSTYNALSNFRQNKMNLIIITFKNNFFIACERHDEWKWFLLVVFLFFYFSILFSSHEFQSSNEYIFHWRTNKKKTFYYTTNKNWNRNVDAYCQFNYVVHAWE